MNLRAVVRCLFAIVLAGIASSGGITAASITRPASLVKAPLRIVAPSATVPTLVNVLITGTITTGWDYTNTFGLGFSPYPGPGNLNGKKFTLVYTMDTSKGIDYWTNTLLCQNGLQNSGLHDTPVPKAVLTINNKSWTFGTFIQPNTTSSNPYTVTSWVSYSSSKLSNPQIDMKFRLDNQFSGYDSSPVSGPDSVAGDININGLGSICRLWSSPFSYKLVPSKDSAVLGFDTNLVKKGSTTPGAFASFNGNLSVQSVTVSGPITAAATPHILFYDENLHQTVDVTNKAAPPVVVGQAIPLFAAPSGAGTNQPWQVYLAGHLAAYPTQIVGGYTPTECDSLHPTSIVSACQPSGLLVPTDFANPAGTQFYWVTPGTYTVFYSYNQSNGNKASVWAIFTVQSAPAPSWKARVNPCSISPNFCDISLNKTGHPIMNFGTNLCDSKETCYDGMAIGTAADPKTLPSGSYSWVQVVRLSGATFSDAKGDIVGQFSDVPNSLDGKYPYDSLNATAATPAFPKYLGLITLTSGAQDSPWTQLDCYPTATTVTRVFTAEMYSMWQSTIADSIPVPQGALTWQFQETASKKGNSWTMPELKNIDSAKIASPGYPTWLHVTTGPVQVPVSSVCVS